MADLRVQRKVAGLGRLTAAGDGRRYAIEGSAPAAPHRLTPGIVLMTDIKLRLKVEEFNQFKKSHVEKFGGAGGGTRTPTSLSALRIFLPAMAFAAPTNRVCGLDYPFTLA